MNHIFENKRKIGKTKLEIKRTFISNDVLLVKRVGHLVKHKGGKEIFFCARGMLQQM